jgi:hypothetical protein
MPPAGRMAAGKPTPLIVGKGYNHDEMNEAQKRDWLDQPFPQDCSIIMVGLPSIGAATQGNRISKEC